MEDEARLKIRVSDDRLEAYAQVGAGPCQEPSAIQERLEAMGISAGLDENAIERIGRALEVEAGQADEHLIARGRSPEPPTPPSVELMSPIGPIPGTLREDGSLDYRLRGTILPVEVEEVLGRVKPAIAGKAGEDVYGEAIEPDDLPELDWRHGDGVEIRDDGAIVALRTGARAIERDGVVDVVALYIHPAAVDMVSGDLQSSGSLSVARDVGFGMTVEAENDISIGGNLDGGVALAGGSIEVTGGAIGRDHGRLKAGANVRLRHALDMRIECGETLHIARSVSGSRLYAHEVIVEGRMLGNLIEAERRICVKDAGSPGGGQCTLRAAIPRGGHPASGARSGSRGRKRRDPLRESGSGKKNAKSKANASNRGGRHGARTPNSSDRAALDELLDFRRRERKLQREASIEITGTAHAGCRFEFGGRPLVLEAPISSRRLRFDIDRDEIISEEL
jgi:hypothetical protein